MSNTQSSVVTARQDSDQIALRKKSIAARAALTAIERKTASDKIVDTVVHSSWFRRAKLVACYLPARDEVDTWLLIERAWRMKKRTFAPVVQKSGVLQLCELTPESRLLPNVYGLSEPYRDNSIAPRALDLVITPVVSFDANRNRIGMGGGYFDRTFSFLRHRQYLFHPKLIGLAFACQRVEKVAANPWDIRVFRMVDETT